MSSVLVLTYSVLDLVSRELVTPVAGMAVVAGVSAAYAIRLGNRLRFPIMAASSTILGVGFLTLSMIPFSRYVSRYVELLSFGFAVGFSAGIGVLLWRVLCGRRLSQSLLERAPPTSDVA